jgi:hypothetical protein
VINYWLVTVDVFSIKIESVPSLNKWDWSCEIEGDTNRYRITSGVFNMPPLGMDRAQVEIMYHARNLAGEAPIVWAARGSKPAVISKRTREAKAKTKRMFD